MKSSLSAICTVAVLFLLVGCGSESKEQTAHVEDGPRRIEILFLGHSQEHHNSRAYFPVLASALAKDGINITYTEEVTDLNEKNLAAYDGLIIYANHDDINPSEEKALIDYVKEGHAFIPIHCASFCFRNSEDYVDMVGGQFKSHETGTFTANIVDKEHPIMQNVSEFSTWDETYVHDKIADDIQILMEILEYQWV